MTNNKERKDVQDELSQVHLSVTYPRIYLDFARERGVDPLSVLQKAGLNPSLFDEQNNRISLQEHLRLIAAVVDVTGDCALGFELGLRVPITAHGSLGYALMCCGTLGEAVDLLQRFWPIRGSGIGLAYSHQEEWNRFELRFEMPLPDALALIVQSFVVTSFYQGMIFLMGRSDPPAEIWFQHAQPPGFERFREKLPVVRFEMPITQIRIAGSEYLDQRLAMSNPEALGLAIAQCEREYALLNNSHDDTLARARALMNLGPQGYPEPEELAQVLCMSPRTFRRRLQLRGSSYKNLLIEARRRDALALLERPELTIQRVAELLGYTNPANFTRAFRLWTGRSPREYRAIWDRSLTATVHADEPLQD